LKYAPENPSNLIQEGDQKEKLPWGPVESAEDYTKKGE